MEDVVTIYEAPQQHAYIVAGALRSNGIEAQVVSGHFETFLHPTLGLFRVLVRAEDAEEARRFIEDQEVPDPVDPPPSG